MKNGDFVLIDYVGRIKNTNEIFDLTKEDIAKKEGIYDPKFSYKPIPVIIGSGFVFKRIEDNLKEMKVGESRKIILKYNEAFGERREELIKLLPLSIFKESNIAPGKFVDVGGLRGKVLSISGGRVRVDFNHPLAGKDLEYLIEVKRFIETIEEKVKAIVKIFTGIEFFDVDVKVENNIVEIKIKKRISLSREIKEKIVKTIFRWIKDVEKIKFIEEFER